MQQPQNIIIKKLILENFKGIKSLEVDFNEQLTSIFGANATGKTTIFDAFTWLLFGKDSQDKKDFNIKTLEADGKAINRLDHRVTGHIQVDNYMVVLERHTREKWVKRRGSALEEFSGHESSYKKDGVPLSLADYQMAVNSIIPEATFKVLTNPYYFNQMPWQDRRTLLFTVAGNVSDQNVAHGHPDLQELLTKGNLDQLKKQIQTRKAIIKAELDNLPVRIDEVNKSREALKVVDVVKLKEELAGIDQALLELDNKLAGIRLTESQTRLQHDKDMESAKAIRFVMIEAENKVKDALSKDYNQWQNDLTITTQAVKNHSMNLETAKLSLSSITQQLQEQTTNLDRQRESWKVINATPFEGLSDTDKVCPTCNRELDAAHLATSTETAKEAFMQRKRTDLENNTTVAKSIQGVIANLERNKVAAEKHLADTAVELEKARAEIKLKELDYKPVTDQDINDTLEKDLLYKKNREMYNKIMAPTPQAPDTGVDAILANKRELNVSRDQINQGLLIPGQREGFTKRIEELQVSQRTLSQELAALERDEFLIDKFMATKIALVEQQINGLFNLVKFKMFKTQINGGLEECCEAIIDGVPYQDINHAGQINAGMDIINAIGRHYNTTAPIFVDNAEAVNQLQPTPSQVIRLVVTENPTLHIVSENI